MKVRLGNYKRWYGPYQIAKILCFWIKDKDSKFVDNLGDFLSVGEWGRRELKAGEVGNLFPMKETWFVKVLQWIDSKKERKVKIKIDPWDTFNADHTLSLIIVPLLKQFKESIDSVAMIDNEDLPEELQNHGKDFSVESYNYVLDEIIWAHEQIISDGDGENQFYTSSTEDSPKVKKLENGSLQIINNTLGSFDREGYKKYNDRINNGLRLFGKYYRSLWN